MPGKPPGEYGPKVGDSIRPCGKKPLENRAGLDSIPPETKLNCLYSPHFSLNVTKQSIKAKVNVKVAENECDETNMVIIKGVYRSLTHKIYRDVRIL